MPIERAYRLGIATAAVDLLKQNGETPKIALSKVAKLLKREGVNAKQLDGIGRRLRAGRYKNEVAKGIYHKYMVEAKERGAGETADKIMTMLAPPKDTK